eukprot:Clim_evm142s149 gene=Clim_evmTU142s149
MGKDKHEESSRPLELDPQPEFIEHRLKLWDQYMKQHEEEVAKKAAERSLIKILLPDGTAKEGIAWETTPYKVAETISKGLADNSVISKVNGDLWDLDRPLEDDCNLQLLKFEDKEAQAVFWHSSAHVLGQCLEKHYGGNLCYGPPIEEGFYYDMFLEGDSVSTAEFKNLEKLASKAVKEKQKFERLELTKEQLKEMFKHNQFKHRILDQKVTTPTTTVYRNGPLIDLCRGPHIRHTGKIKAMTVTKTSSAYWEGKAEAESLQRVYGISFPDNKQMKIWKTIQEEAAKRDHRKIGKEQELFFFDPVSPGSCFFLQRGAVIYNRLVEYMRQEYHKRGFQEVVSPNIFNVKLWETSGHWQHYSENMFSFEVEEEQYALKPMNCPGHCVLFGHRVRSWRELPMRVAEFGVLHRNELSGALTGLTRVRRFVQDDAHIFCMPSQIRQEVSGCLDFLQEAYSRFGFTFTLKLSTRPDKYLGTVEQWQAAEEELGKALDDFTKDWEMNPGDGAFYGPKIDITIQDALRRQHQCATIQLDFQLPERFNLSYVGKDTQEGEINRPVIIHRAILGSVERMIAILTEACGGKWPFWLSPRQVALIPVGTKHEAFCDEIAQKLHSEGIIAEVDKSSETFNKKVRNNQLAQFNYILVIGDKEVEHKTANVRTRDNKVHGEKAVDEIIDHFRQIIKEKAGDEVFLGVARAAEAAAAEADAEEAAGA